MQTILAAIAHDSLRESVFNSACALATRFSSKLWILEVTPPDPDFIGLDSGPQSVRDSLAKDLAQKHRDVQQLADQARLLGVDAHALLIKGPTGDTLLAEAAKLEADLIVIGNSHHTWLHHLVQGSATDSLVRNSPIPLLLIPAA